MNIKVCDICKVNNNELIEATHINRVKGRGRLDICQKHKGYIKNTLDFVKMLSKVEGIEIDDEQAKSILSNHNNTNKKCKYCGKNNGSSDSNLLCPKCRESFGHSLYSEL